MKPNEPNMPGNNRRSFVARLTGMSALALVSPVANRSNLFAEEDDSTTSKTWDLSWLGDFKGKHKQVFDVGGTQLGENSAVPESSPLRVPKNYLNAHKEVFGLGYPSINTAVGMTRTAYPINATDVIWAKYSLGERWKIKDPKTGTWAVRNVFADSSLPMNDQSVTVQALQKRGTMFWQCNNALDSVVRSLSEAMKLDAEAVRADLVGGLLPGVKLVAAHTFVLGLVQERGFTYEKI